MESESKATKEGDMNNTENDLDFNIDFQEPVSPVSQGQWKFINNLRQDWQRAEDELAKLVGRAPSRPTWSDPETFDEASTMIAKGVQARTEKRDALTRARRAQHDYGLAEGLYVIGDNPDTRVAFKVQKARNGSGMLYAKVLQADGWTYEGRTPLHDISRRGHRMRADEARWYGKDANSPIRGECVACGTPLTYETSLYYGYGSTCADHHGWPYVDKIERQEA